MFKLTLVRTDSEYIAENYYESFDNARRGYVNMMDYYLTYGEPFSLVLETGRKGCTAYYPDGVVCSCCFTGAPDR